MKKLLTFVALFLAFVICTLSTAVPVVAADYIKWVDFKVASEAMADALDYDTSTYGTDEHLKMSTLLSLLAVKYGGDFKNYKKSDLEKITERVKSGEKIEDIATNAKLLSYYTRAYSAVFDGMVCEYDEYTVANDGSTTKERKYGLCAYSPIASGYYYNHYDDFGASRSFGYKREHLGHDLMGSVGTPIIAVEAGYVEACGWNMYGGWRVGIRSFDGKRYYYYAHLRKGHPYADMYEGKIVAAGEVIGYLGMTGYSRKEDVNNITEPHLHWGLQLIFDKSQKDGSNQIWLDMYALTNFLSKYRAQTAKGENERYSVKYKIPAYMWD